MAKTKKKTAGANISETVNQGKLSFSTPVEVGDQQHVADVNVTVNLKKTVTITAALKWTTKHIGFTEDERQSVLAQMQDLLAVSYYRTCEILNQAIEDKRKLDFPGQTALFEGQSATEEDAQVGQPSV